MSTHARNPQPPRWLDKLIERFCAPHLLEQVMGDLHERYYRRAKREGEAGEKNVLEGSAGIHAPFCFQTENIVLY